LRLVLAVHEVTATTPITRTVVSAQEAQADAISDLPAGDSVPDRVNDADDLVAGHNRHTGVGTHALHTKHVAVAHTAALNLEPDMTGTGRDKFAVHQLKLSLTSHLESTVSSHLVLLVEVNNVGGEDSKR
jgi:hypothetical protein